MEQQDRILGYFLEESKEHLNTIEEGLQKLSETVRQPEMIRELFRAAHSIVGSAAMLGLNDVQQIGKQFESNFKLLKEHRIAVDTRLQSLFLESFAFLRAAIEEVSGSSDPYHHDPNSPPPVGDPVFEELKAYLQHLLKQADLETSTATNPEQNLNRDPAIDQVFGEYVTRKLREIQELCLQPDRPEVRGKIKQICQKLGNLGENFEFLEWTNLFVACRLATANPLNSLNQLGERIGIAVKQSQMLILSDRHQSICVPPDLQALIDYQYSTDSNTSNNASTFKLDDFTKPALQVPIVSPNLRSSKVTSSLSSATEQNISTGHDFPDWERASSDRLDLDPDLELNEFISLLSDDLPLDGTWKQDEDITDDTLNRVDANELAITTQSITETASPPLTTATANLGAAPELNIEHPTIQTGDDANGAVDYDEETFYNPELEDIDLQTFWAEDLETANRVLEPLNELDFTDSSIHQFQPEHPPIEDDITPPDFTLDAPMSDLFIPIAIPVEGTVAFPSEDRAKLPASQAEVAPEIVEDRAKLPASQTEVDPEIVSSILQSEDYANANSDILFLEDLNRDDLPKSTPAIFQWEDYANANSDVLFLEDLNRNELSKSFAQDNIATGVTDWVNESSDPHQKNADFADLNLGAAHLASVVRPTTDDSENRLGIGDFKELNLVEIDELDSITDATNDCDFVDLNLQPILQESDYVDSNLDLISDLDIHDNFFGSNLDEINELDFGADAVIHDNFSELNIENINELKSSDNPIFYDSFGGLNIADIEDLPEIGNDLGGLNIADTEDLPAAIDTLAIDDNFAQLNLEDIGDIHSIASPDEMLRQSDWADLNIEDIGGSKSRIDPPLDASFANSNLDDLGNLELNINTSTQLDLIHSNLEDIDRANSQQFANIDLESNLGSDRDFADLDFEHMGLGLGDLSDLDFDDDLSSDPLLDLDKLVSDNPIATATELADLNSLIIGGAAIGVGGALLSTAGSELDDLDALVSNPTPVATPDNSLSDLDSLLTTPAPVVEPVGAKTNKKTTERRSKQRTFDPTMKVSVKHLNNLNNLVGELVVNRNTLEQDQNRMRQFIEKLLSEVQKLNEVGKRMQDLYERSLMENSLIASRQQSKNVAAPPLARIENLDNISEMEYDPLEMDRFTPIHLLSQKMIELTVRIRESTSDIEFVVDGSTEVTRTLRQITGQLQEDLTKSRMIPFAQTADRLQRGVRENGLKYGKQVELAIEGRDTLIDKVILESLTDPLIHMVNNGIAHGIESPETRQQFDKPPTGKISIRALHQGNQTIISISDDGAGINTEIVKTKAIQKGIITAKQAATMTKAEVYELLFLPSFSTKDQADELAGRGVGMDVVRTSLAEIRGTITTESQIGLGTTFTIRLPLALSIAKALIAIDNKTNIAFPMDGIEDTQDVSPEQIQKNNQGESCIFWRDSLMPFKPLSDLLGFNRPLPRNNFYPTQDDDNDLVSILILRSDGNLIAVQVDKITGEQEIAIKPLQGPASKPVGIAGATVLGDGRIVPIADVMELIDLAKGKITRHISTKWSMETSAPTSERRESMVLIVDDSITVRELLSLTFKRAGYRVEQARDGQEAWDKLRAGLPCDIVFCDIEMPRMDGLEFLSRVQKDVALSKVPVAMLTSRGSDRHRQIAAQLGASGYFIKPYLEEALLDAAKRMIRGEFLAIV